MPGHDHSRHGHGAPTSRDSSFWNSRAFLVFLGFAAIALVRFGKSIARTFSG